MQMSGEAQHLLIITMTGLKRVRKAKVVLMNLLTTVHDLTLRRTMLLKGLGACFVFYLEKQEA